jgi:hypothetical protein
VRDFPCFCIYYSSVRVSIDFLYCQASLEPTQNLLCVIHAKTIQTHYSLLYSLLTDTFRIFTSSYHFATTMIYCNEMEQTLFSPLPHFLTKKNRDDGNDLFVYHHQVDDDDDDNDDGNDGHESTHAGLTSRHPLLPLPTTSSRDGLLPSYLLLSQESYPWVESISQNQNNGGGQVQALFSRSGVLPSSSSFTTVGPISPTTPSRPNSPPMFSALPWQSLLLPPQPSPPSQDDESFAGGFFFFRPSSKQQQQPQRRSKHRIDRRELYHHHHHPHDTDSTMSTSDDHTSSSTATTTPSNEQGPVVRKRQTKEGVVVVAKAANNIHPPLAPPSCKTASSVLCFLTSSPPPPDLLQ